MWYKVLLIVATQGTVPSEDRNNFPAKPQVSVTVPNRDHFAQVSLAVLDIFGCICLS